MSFSVSRFCCFSILSVSKSALDAKCRTLTSDTTALHLAAITGAKQIPGLLLEKGADFKKKDGDGMTVLHRAIEYSNNSLAQLLLTNG